jgi:nickel transport protein
MKKLIILLVILSAVFTCVPIANAHFVMIIPSTDVVGKDSGNQLSLLIQFTHPFQGKPRMQMDKPEKFGVVSNGAVTDLLGSLNEKKVNGKSSWQTTFKVTRPADYIFFVQPKPYWEPAEDRFIVQFTKVIVDAFDAGEGWDKPIAASAGIPVEIVPMTRPYSLYEGNIFTGQVFRNGKPVPGVEVEVVWWGQGKTKAPTDEHITQAVKADPNGVFSFAMPKSGWWGFSAVMASPEPINHDGKNKKVETDAILWVHTYPMQ